MPRILPRKTIQNPKMASDDTNIMMSRTQKKRLRNAQTKTKNASKLYEKRSTDVKDSSNTAAYSKKTHSSPFSIICSLPLYKISGILEKIETIDSKILNRATNYRFSTNTITEDSDQIIKPCLKMLCLYCDKKFSSHNIYKKHVEKLHTSSKTRRFSRRNSNLKPTESKHHVVHTPSPTLYYTGCCYCKNSKQASAPQDFMGLFFHMVDFHSEKYFGCKLCILRFQSRGKLIKHMNVVHKNTSTVMDENWLSKDEAHSGLFEISDRYQIPQSHLRKSFTSIQSPNLTLYKIDCSNIVKNLVFNGDEPILSRLGVTQNRLPIRKSLRNCRDGIMTEILPKIDPLAGSSKIRGKVAKAILPSDCADTIFRVPTKNDTSCLFEEDFYGNVISNVRKNIIYYLDGKIMMNTQELDTLNQNFHYKNSEIHKATNILTSTPFPTLLTSEQYGVDVSSAKIKRSITKHSWKWKWDSFKKFKLVNEGGKIVKKIKQPILNLRDLSKLDMWTQLTMRQKTKLTLPRISGNKNVLSTEDKQILSNQLSTILDTRILPQIILEQSEETIVKLEYENIQDSFDFSDSTDLPINESDEFYNFFSKLKLLPVNLNTPVKHEIILSGEWARPRCYLCIGCGTKFEKLKTLEEHKMFRHSHVYSTHYEIVGRELMDSNLLRNFFIPKRAFSRYTSSKNLPEKFFPNKIICRGQSDLQLGYESSNNMKQFLRNSHTTECGRISNGLDTDFKMLMHLSSASPTSSTQSIMNKCGSESTSSSQIYLGKEGETSAYCTKCNKKYSAVYDLYRHMLDCSGDYIWSLAKKRKYRYYCGSKKRRQCNKTYRTVIKKKKKQKTLNDRKNCSEVSQTLLKTKTLPRQRPSDAESIKKMLENLPPKRVCKKTFPILNKTRKSRLVVKRKGFNSQGLKRKLSKHIRKTSALLYKFKFTTSTLNANEQNVQETNIAKTTQKAQDTTNDVRIESELNISQTNRQTINKAAEETIKDPDNRTDEINEFKKKLVTGAFITPTTKNSTSMPRKIFLESSPITCKDADKDQSTVESVTNDMLKKGLGPLTDKLPSNFYQTNYKKKRSKKISDCIAMLTGKLEQKLQTAKLPESESEYVNYIERKNNSPVINKTAKRKTYSRKILKPTLDQLNNEIDSKPTLGDNQSLRNTNLENSTNNKFAFLNCEINAYEKTPLSDTNISTTKKLILTRPRKLTAPSCESSDMPSDILSETPTKSSHSLCAPALTPLNLYSTSPQNTQIISESLASNSIIGSSSPYVKPSLFTRRQTICGNESVTFTCKPNDDVRPLDLSMKANNTTQIHFAAIPSTDSLINSSTRSKRFTSCLNLLKIPQVNSPPKNSDSLYQKYNSKKISKNKNVSGSLNSASVSKKDRSRSSNTQKMDEVIIGHINDAINSVVNAEKKMGNPDEGCIEKNMASKILNCKSDTILDTSLKKTLNKTNLKQKILIGENSSGLLQNYSNSTEELNTLPIKTSDVDIFMPSDISEKAPTKIETNFNITNNSFTETETPCTVQVCELFKENDSQPLKKQRKRRKNELAAIVADQLLESFKIDKVRRDNLRKLENLAYEKSEDLLAGMVFMSSTKRLQKSKNSSDNNKTFSENSVALKHNTPDQLSKHTKSINTDNSKEIKDDKCEKVLERDSTAEWKKLKKHQLKKNEKCAENENIKMKTCLESFTLISLRADTLPNYKSIHTSTESNYLKNSSELSPKNSTILRPSILTKILEPLSVSNSLAPDKTNIQSRDPRLNKHIHSKENVLGFPGLFSRHRLRSTDVGNQESTVEILYDTEEDNYLNEIARDVNEKVMSLENADFKFVSDEFEIGSTCPENSDSKYCRSSTSMSVCSAPISVEENTNTVDLDDNLSVYTSFSQDVNRRHKKKRRRRSILFSRKQKKKWHRDMSETTFECILCKKTFNAASSLTKHQTTLAHVSKVSEQEYLFSTSQGDTKGELVPSQENFKYKTANDKKGPEKNHCIPQLRSYIALNPDEKLFFECCNILKGSESLNVTNIEPTDTTKYRNLKKKETRNFTNLKINSPVNLYYSKQVKPEKAACELGLNEELFQGPLNNESTTKNSKDIHTKINPNDSPLPHTSGVNINTNTVSRFKTKAAMKGYDHMSDLNFNCDISGKSRSSCKLTALAEIALGNEKSNSKDSGLPNAANDLTQCKLVIRNTIDSVKEFHTDSNKESKKSGNYDTTSSKTIMHCSVMKTATSLEESHCQPKKIIIPERPFMNIGLEEKQTIKFEKPKSNVNLINTEDKGVLPARFSDRNDFNLETLHCSIDKKIKKDKAEKECCTNSNLSKTTLKAFENKSLVVGRIFRNANQKNNNLATITGGSPKTDFSFILDELIESIPNSTKVQHSNNKIPLPTFSEDACRDVPVNYPTILQEQPTHSKIYLKEKQKTKLQLELGMSTEEIAQLIDERQRKPKRRCANRPKKLVEMWSSDEYEEFLSTNDVFALIEEKEKEEKRKKRKSRITNITMLEAKADLTINPKKGVLESDKFIEGNFKKDIKTRKQKQVELSNKFKPNKQKLTEGLSTASKLRKGKTLLLSKDIKETRNSSKRAINLLWELSKKTSSNKTTESRRDSQPMASNTRRRRLASEKLYYWSSSSDEELDRANSKVVKDCETKEQYQKHGWIVGDSHKKLVTLLAITKGNKKVENCGVKKKITKKRN